MKFEIIEQNPTQSRWIFCPEMFAGSCLLLMLFLKMHLVLHRNKTPPGGSALPPQNLVIRKSATHPDTLLTFFSEECVIDFGECDYPAKISQYQLDLTKSGVSDNFGDVRKIIFFYCFFCHIFFFSFIWSFSLILI